MFYDYSKAIDKLVAAGEISLADARRFEEKLSELERRARQGDVSSFYQLQEEVFVLERMARIGSKNMKFSEIQKLFDNGQINSAQAQDWMNKFMPTIRHLKPEYFDFGNGLLQSEEEYRKLTQNPPECFAGYDVVNDDKTPISWVHKTTTSGNTSSYSTYTAGRLPEMTREDMARIYHTFNIDPREETMTTILKTRSVYDYSQDAGFVFPIDEPVPAGYNVDRVNITQNKAFKDLVYKAWGKVVNGVDPTKSGGYTLLGDGWVSCRVNASISNSQSLTSLDLDEYQTNFPLVAQTWAEFSGDEDREAIVLSISHGHQTVVLLLINRKVAQQLDLDGSEGMYAAQSRFEVVLPNVKVPFPFNQNGDYNTRFAHYNTANVRMEIEVDEHYGVMLIGHTDFQSKVATIEFFPPNDNHIIPGSVRLGVQGRNVFNGIADVLWYAQENKILGLQGAVSKSVKVHEGARNKILVKALAGSEVKEEFKKFIPPEVKAPYGLDRLPLCPEGYHFIGDAGGFIYLTDKKGEHLYLPYEIFDLNKLIAAVEKTEAELAAKKQQPNGALLEMRQQIILIRKLFEHQAGLLQGKAFNYEAMAAQDFTKPSPFVEEDDEDDDIY